MALGYMMQQKSEQIDEPVQRGDTKSTPWRAVQGRGRSPGSLQKLSVGGPTTPFVDLAFAHYLFTERLHTAAVARGAQDLFFFSREGQPLKEMFDFYQSLHPEKAQIRSHYLRVSRRSTFLLSLGPIAQESFDVLFRQYRSISVADFLKSLELEDHVVDLAAGLAVDNTALNEVSADLPTDPLFKALLDSERFRRLYEEQREARSEAFARYLASHLAGQDVPSKVYVVDVGWKGSIQDNVYHWLQRRYGPAAEVEGFYLGLIATGAMSESNRKTGLLFSNVGRHSEGFYGPQGEQRRVE